MNAALVILSVVVLLGSTPADAAAQSHERETIIENFSGPGNGGWLGVSIEDLTPEVCKELKTSTKEGVVVTSVKEESPAQKAGLQKNDIIVAVNGHAVSDRWDLLKRIRSEDPGSSVSLSIVRTNEKRTLTAVLEGSDEHEMRVEPMLGSISPPFYRISESETQGLRLKDLNDQLGEFFGAPNDRGVLVEEVLHDSPAAVAGFKAGDVIVRVGKDPIEDILDVRNAMRHYDGGDSALVEVLRKGSSLTLSLKLGGQEHGRYQFRSGGISPSWHDGSFERDSHEFQSRMRDFGDRMKKFGKDLEIRMKGLRDRIRDQLRHIEV